VLFPPVLRVLELTYVSQVQQGASFIHGDSFDDFVFIADDRLHFVSLDSRAKCNVRDIPIGKV
jgi:hypothetical protein